MGAPHLNGEAMAFYNSTATERLADTILTLRVIMPKDLERESVLVDVKWFGYRFMSPLAATKHFAEVYREGVRRYTRTHGDIELSDRVSGLSLNVFAEPSGSLTELWRARQDCDELGLPYELLVDFGFEFAGRRKWKRTPRPCQLFGSKKSAAAWKIEFAKYLADRLPMALDRLSGLPQYRVESYRALAAQDQFRSHLLDHISDVNKPWGTAIGKQCIENRHLPLLSTMRLVPKRLRDGVMSEIRSDMSVGILEPVHRELVPLIAFAPACFGLPPAKVAPESGCTRCPMADQCVALIEVTSRRMQERYGSISPVKESRDNNRREKTRLRVAKCRANKKKDSGSPQPLAGTM